MNRFIARMAFASLVMVGLGKTASADLVYALKNVEFSDGTFATGTFSISSLTGPVTSYNITTTTTAAPFTGYHYTPLDSTNSSSIPTYINLDASGNRELRFYFTSALTATGATITTNGTSYEHQNGNRLVISGTVAAIPEPGTLALSSAGLTVMAGLGYSRRRRVAVA